MNNDSRIVEFSQGKSSAEQLERELEAARRIYEQKIWLSSFNFQNAINATKELQQFVSEYASSFNPETLNWIDNLLQKLAAIQDTSAKFHTWLNAQFQLPEALTQNTILQQKTKSGAVHFTGELENCIQLLKQSPAITDSRMHAKEYNENIKEIFAQLSIKKHLLAAFSNDFNLQKWQKLKREFVLPYFSVNAYAGAAQKQTNSPHPLLHQQLRKLRDTFCERKNLPIYMVAGSKTLDEMAEFLPQNLDELAKINGFGPAKLNAYGEQFLTIIRQYCMENNLESRLKDKIQSRKKTETKAETKAPKIDTKAESFRLYKEGKRWLILPRERNLIPQTIEGHLAHYLSKGEIPIEELIGMEKVSINRTVN